MTDTIQDRLRDQRWNNLGYYTDTAHDAAAHIDAQDAKIKALVEALEELVTCVDDGCYCSEMKMASAIDTANETIAAAKETT